MSHFTTREHTVGKGVASIEIIANSIGVWKNRVPADTCREIISVFEEKEASIYEERGTTHIPDGEQIYGMLFRNDQKRDDISIELDNYESLFRARDLIEWTLYECADEYFEWFASRQREWEPVDLHVSREKWNPEGQSMVYKVQKTLPYGGFSMWHNEQGPCDLTRGRYAVWMLYLNDVHRDGGTDFPVQQLRMQPTEGTMVIWPAAYTHPHRSSPDIEETKYIVTGWIEHKGSSE